MYDNSGENHSKLNTLRKWEKINNLFFLLAGIHLCLILISNSYYECIPKIIHIGLFLFMIFINLVIYFLKRKNEPNITLGFYFMALLKLCSGSIENQL